MFRRLVVKFGIANAPFALKGNPLRAGDRRMSVRSGDIDNSSVAGHCGRGLVYLEFQSGNGYTIGERETPSG